MGSDTTGIPFGALKSGFQSTLPGWGATTQARETRDKQSISIHAPRMGSDRRDGRPRTRIVISIHAPRMGSDPAMVRRFPAGRYFNPRSPDGERPCPATIRPLGSRFQSTLPGWGATNQLLTNPSSQGISIHAPRMGSDRNMSRRPRSRTGISIHAPRMGSDCGLRRRCG